MLDWHKGPPPHVGWWEASRFSERGIWRWWDGFCWSLGANEFDSAEFAGTLATCKDRTCADVVWTNRYPANARVPRVAAAVDLDAAQPRLPITSTGIHSGNVTALCLDDDKAVIRQALSFVETTEYCFPVSAQPVLEALRHSLEIKP